MGLSYQEKGQNEEAIKSYKQAVEIADEKDHNDMKAKACQRLGNIYTRASEYKKAIEYYQKAREILPSLKADELEVAAYQRLGYNHYHDGQFKESIECYKEVVTLAAQLGNKKRECNAYLGLGSAFSNCGDFESSQIYFLKALSVVEDLNERHLQIEAHVNLGHMYYKSSKFDSAVKSYLEAQKVFHELEDKNGELNSYLLVVICHSNTGNQEQAKKYYQKAKIVAATLGNKYSEGTILLMLASVCMKDCNYKMAVEWYDKAVHIFGTELNDPTLMEKALAGLAAACFSLGDSKKAIESIQEAQKVVKKGTNTGKDIPIPEMKSVKDSSLNEQKDTENFAVIEESEQVTDEWVDSFIEQACNPSRTEKISSEDLLRVQKHFEYTSSSYVYTRTISSKEPFTDKVRKAMTQDVKTSAYNNLLCRNNDDHPSSYYAGDSAREDKQVFNFARDQVTKNASTKRPARLNKRLVSYMKSVGKIACGSVCGTCFLVKDMLVITNYHVYRMINKERNEPANVNLPITVSFDYLRPGQTEDILTVEVDEEQDTNLENLYLDYKFFRLKENIGRDPLGPMVRDFQLEDGRVVILGHPEGKEMQEEVCIVVGYRACAERIRSRHEQFNGVHMTNAQLLDRTERFQGCLSYDTSFFHGSSGSPVFDMNGNIIAMHTQGYLLEREENVPDDENGSSPTQMEVCISRRYSLMEFGVQFFSICRDIKRWHGEKVVEEIFPNYDKRPLDHM